MYGSLYNEYRKGYDLCMEHIQNLLAIDLKLNFRDPNNLPEGYVALYVDKEKSNEYLAGWSTIDSTTIPFKVGPMFIEQVKNFMELAAFYKEKMDKENQDNLGYLGQNL